MRAAVRWLYAILLGVALLSCAPRSVVQIEVHPIMAEYDAPPQYRIWWNQMVACTKKTTMKKIFRTYQYHELRFVVVETMKVGGSYGFVVDPYDVLADGLTDENDTHGPTIFAAQHQMFDRKLIGHEMLHALGYPHDPRLLAACGVAL